MTAELTPVANTLAPETKVGATSNWQKLSKLCKSIRDWQPLTVRGVLALCLSLAALKFYALPESDLVAYVIGGATIFILALSVIVGLLARLIIGRKVSTQLRFDERNAISGREIDSGIILSPFSVPPFYFLSVKRCFAQAGAHSPLHLIRGRAMHNEKRHLLDTVAFPHRGVWKIIGLNCTLSDCLGFTSLSWTVSDNSSVEVSAPTIPIRPLPIVFGSSRAGDQLSLSRERTGDLFDMKPYDPSDGISRILWKTYARSGELVVRRPEPAVIPEGEVAIYLVCERSDDFVVGALQSYLSELHSNQITVLFGTDGLSDASKQHGYLTQPEEIQHAINGCVWSKKVGTGLDFQSYVDALVEDRRVVHRVVVFFADRGTHNWVNEVTKIAQKSYLKVTAVLVPQNLVQKDFRAIPTLNSRLKFKRQLNSAPFASGELASSLIRSGAETIICEGFGS